VVSGFPWDSPYFLGGSLHIIPIQSLGGFFCVRDDWLARPIGVSIILPAVIKSVPPRLEAERDFFEGGQYLPVLKGKMWQNLTEALVVITGFHAQEDHHADENHQGDNHTDHNFGSAEEVHHGGGSFLK
jgi:hypothetical protein